LQLPGNLSNPMAESWQMAVDQRQRVLNMVRKHQVKNVVFLAGDYHCSARAELAFTNTLGVGSGDLKAYAIVTPPLYAPLPGANTKASDVLASEWIDLGSGAAVAVKASANGSWLSTFTA
jgi:phosphodiesterase/alkaline phosphatase D-like protein